MFVYVFTLSMCSLMCTYMYLEQECTQDTHHTHVHVCTYQHSNRTKFCASNFRLHSYHWHILTANMSQCMVYIPLCYSVYVYLCVCTFVHCLGWNTQYNYVAGTFAIVCGLDDCCISRTWWQNETWISCSLDQTLRLLFISSINFVWLLFESHDYFRAVTIWEQRLFCSAWLRQSIRWHTCTCRRERSSIEWLPGRLWNLLVVADWFTLLFWICFASSQ